MAGADDAELQALQILLRQALDRLPNARDFYDRQLQTLLGTKGKPIYDIQRGKVKNPGTKTRRAISQVLGIKLDALMDPTLAVARLAGPNGFEAPPSALIDMAANTSAGQGAVEGRPNRPPAKLQPIAAANDDEVVDIIALDLSLSMGPGTIVEDFVEEEIVKMDLAFIRSITRTPSDRLRLVRGIGESMEPTLRTSDRILIDINERQLTRIDGLYWIDHFGSHGLKRLRAVGRDRVRIISDNPNVSDDEVAADELLIHGRAIWFGREL